MNFVPQEESPYGTFGAVQSIQEFHPSSSLQPKPSHVPPTFNETETPYGYFGMEDLPTASPFQTPRSLSQVSSPPSQSNAQVFTFQQQPSHSQSESSVIEENNYGYFNPELISPPSDIHRITSHDQIMMTASCDSTHLDAPSCYRSISDTAPKNRISVDVNSFPNALRLHQSQSHRVTLSNGSSPMNRLELSSLLDESCHQAWKERKYHEAFKITDMVHSQIKSYLENLRRLHSSNGEKGERSPSESETLLLSDLTEWIPSAAATEDLTLLAKTLAQKGDIQKASALLSLGHDCHSREWRQMWTHIVSPTRR
jgi:hypothetical protein